MIESDSISKFSSLLKPVKLSDDQLKHQIHKFLKGQSCGESIKEEVYFELLNLIIYCKFVEFLNRRIFCEYQNKKSNSKIIKVYQEYLVQPQDILIDVFNIVLEANVLNIDYNCNDAQFIEEFTSLSCEQLTNGFLGDFSNNNYVIQPLIDDYNDNLPKYILSNDTLLTDDDIVIIKYTAFWKKYIFEEMMKILSELNLQKTILQKKSSVLHNKTIIDSIEYYKKNVKKELDRLSKIICKMS
jgi:hypothetical protein